MMIDLLQYPLFNTKKINSLVKKNQFLFDVDKKLTKPQIKKLVEDFFKIKVLSVNTHRLPKKNKSTHSSLRFSKKRVIIRVNSTINLFN